MADATITYGPWEPYRAPHMSPALSEAINVLPVAGAYAPFASFTVAAGVTLPAPAMGFYAAPLADGRPIIYGATGTQIYRINNGSLTLAYSNPGQGAANWSFAKFAGRIIAVNPNVAPLGAAPGSSFVPLGGDPPPAHVVGVVEKNFLVLGNIVNDGIDGAVPNRVRWAGFNNPDTWGTDVGTQADFEDMPDEGGPVVAITGRETGTVFQRKAIVRMQFVGGGPVFSFTTVEQGRGPVSTGAVCNAGNLDFFIADDGFFVWDGTSAIPIGSGKVDRWFSERVDHNRLDRIVSGFDPVTRCVLWAFPEQGQLSPSMMIAFSMADQRWSQVQVAMQQIGASATLPATLESMPAPDLFDGSFDDPAYAGGRPYLAGIDSSGNYGTFSGLPLASTISTGDWQAAPGQRTFVQGVRPIIDCSGVQVSVGEREQESADAIAWAAASALGVDGTCPQRVDARYIRYRQTTPANDVWTRSVGLEPMMRASGRR
jgi:hypothetical protein